MKRILATAAAVGVIGLALTACETATPYQPANPSAAQSGGYGELRLEPDRWRVTFQGNGLTSRETVETYLLYRAAELTLAQGFDWFEAADRSTDKHVETYADPDPFYGPGWGWGWRPSWRYYGSGYGWRGWEPDWGGPFFDVQTVERYPAQVEIVMHHGAKPDGDRHAYDAHAVT